MGARFTVKKSGTAANVLREVRRRMEDKAERGNGAVAMVVYNASQELVPVDTGVLKKSGRVTKEGKGFACVYVIGYGGTDLLAEFVVSPETGFIGLRKASEYAVPVHELPAHHAVGQADFLREPINTKQDDMRRALKAEVTK